MEQVKVSVEEASEVDRNVIVTVPRDLFDRKYNEAIRVTGQRVSLKGFRPGKAPASLVKKLYGESIQGDVVIDFLAQGYHDAVKEHNLNVVGGPRLLDVLDEDAEKDVLITAAVSVMPEPSIDGFDKIEISIEEEEFSEDAVESTFDRLKSDFAEERPVTDRDVATESDLATIDYDATCDGKPFEGSTGTDVVVELSSEQLPAGFVEGIVGMKVGSEKEITVSFPEDLKNEQLAGKDALYKVSLKSLDEKIPPEITDEFVKQHNFGETVEAFRENIEKRLKRELLQVNKQKKEEALFDFLLEKNSFEVPEVMLDHEIRNMLMEMGAVNPQEKDVYNLDVSKFREVLGDGALKRVRSAIILQQYIAKENIDVGDAEIEKWLDEQASEEGVEREELNKMIGYPYVKSRLQDLVTRDIAIERLLDSAKVTQAKKSDASKSSKGKKAKGKAAAK